MNNIQRIRKRYNNQGNKNNTLRKGKQWTGIVDCLMATTFDTDIIGDGGMEMTTMHSGFPSDNFDHDHDVVDDGPFGLDPSPVHEDEQPPRLGEDRSTALPLFDDPRSLGHGDALVEAAARRPSSSPLGACTDALWNVLQRRGRADGFTGLRGDVEVRLGVSQAGGGAVDFGENMRVMKDAVHMYSQDAYFETGEVTALVKLQPGEEEDEAVIVSMNNVHKTYLLGVEGVPALRGVTLGIRAGEFVCVYGTSGGGKTSLLNLMGTIDKPTKGSIKICGTRITKSTSDSELSDIRRNKLGFVFQTFNLLSSLTALENVELPMILAGRLSRSARRARAVELLTRVGMGARLNHLPNQLSGGEQQRVTIARAIANEPKLLLLDEPTGDLDTRNTIIVMKLLLELNRDDGITLVMVTHDVGLKSYANRVIWMRDGKIQRVEVKDDADIREHVNRLHEDYRRATEPSPAQEAAESPAPAAPAATAPFPVLEDLRNITLAKTEYRTPASYQFLVATS
jgi:putative ABC transport system ATP-binding protein